MHSFHFVFLAAAALLLTISPTAAGITKAQLPAFQPIFEKCSFANEFMENDGKIIELENQLGPLSNYQSPPSVTLPETSSPAQPESLEGHGHGYEGKHKHGYRHKHKEHKHKKHFRLPRPKCVKNHCKKHEHPSAYQPAPAYTPAPPAHTTEPAPVPEIPPTPEEEEEAVDEKWLEVLSAKGEGANNDEKALRIALKKRKRFLKRHAVVLTSLAEAFEAYEKDKSQEKKQELDAAISKCKKVKKPKVKKATDPVTKKDT